MTAVRWALARALARVGLPWSWAAPRWTQAELDDIRRRAAQRYQRSRELFE